jgi:hypothetical protein
MRKHTLSAISLCLAGLATAPALLAQSFGETSPAPAAASQALPTRGQTMGQVERQNGAPTQRYAAVGQPPITRWVYPSMIVYFEYDHVVHTVALRP